jgi:ribosomal protein L15E
VVVAQRLGHLRRDGATSEKEVLEKGYSDRPRRRNGFDPKSPGMNSITEMRRWMEGKARRVERPSPFEKRRKLGEVWFVVTHP